jgi:DNA-binding NtrC family response regulator
MARIWILDAENLLLRLMARWLQHSGHTIVSCPSQESAQARAARIRNGEDLLIMDLSSVDTSGAGLMLKVLIPGLKFLFISEGPMLEWSVRNSALFHALPPGTAHVLRKPFTGLELFKKVEDLIGFPSAATRPASDAATSGSSGVSHLLP